MNELITQTNIPQLLPEMDKKELFNMLSESKPVAELVGKLFVVNGLVPEMVEVETEEDSNIMVTRMRLTLITDVGVYHSFSSTFNKSIAKAMNVFGDDFTKNSYKITTKSKDKKVFYIMNVL